MKKFLTALEALKFLKNDLKQVLSDEEAERESVLILSELLNCKPTEVFLNREKRIEVLKLKRVLKRRLRHEPLEYIFERAYFWGRSFFVRKGVLIPRQETELIVEVFGKIFSERVERILDLGTGSGILAITLALEFPGLKVFAIDISRDALSVAKFNAKLHGVLNDVNFLLGDWTTPFKERSFDVIVSNPPYVSAEEWQNLPAEVRLWEPKLALVAEKRGLSFHEKLIKSASRLLKKGGFLIFEIGYNQRKEVEALLKSCGMSFEFFKDLLGYYRVVVAWGKST